MSENLQLVLHNVGEGIIIPKNGKDVVPIDRAQGFTLEITSTDEDVFGGDGLFPFLSFLKEKGGTLKIKSATTSISHLKVTQGAELKTVARANSVELKTPVSGTCQLDKITGVEVASVIAINDDTGEALERVTETPTTGQFAVTEAGVVTVDSAMTNTIKFNYFATSTKATTSIIKTNAVPGVVEYRHIVETEDEDGNPCRVNIFIPRAKCKGAFTLDFQRGSASAPELEFKILDAGRADKTFIEYTVEPLS